MSELAVPARPSDARPPAARPVAPRHSGARRHGLLVWLLVALAVAGALLPLLWILLTSFTPEEQIISGPAYLPSTLTFDNFTTVWRRGDFPDLMLNSLVVAALTVTISMAVAPLAAYSLSRSRYRGRGLVLVLFLSTRMFPFLLMLIPAYIILRDLGLLDSRLGLALAYTTFSLPAAVWFMKTFFDAIPAEIEEAARIDGSGRFTTFRRIALPLTRPGLMATGVFIGIGAWSEYLFALMLTTSKGSRTWPVGVSLLVGEFQLPYGQLAATGIITVIPILLAYLLVGRNMVRGLMGGAMKG
ncbi:MAG: carbohydrate ABC transporter permease [Chloroflexi bacterium]|nr:carbohydrate ABC transporter permease [Chloroflexota bacterium]